MWQLYSPHTQTQTYTNTQPYFSFFARFLPLALLLCTALEFGQLSLCAQWSLAAPGNNWMKGRWVKGGETERQSESKRKRRRVCKRRTTTSFAFSCAPFSSESRTAAKREGGEGAGPIFITSVLFMLLMFVISVYDHWTVADWSV